jgi:hypothetical protein
MAVASAITNAAPPTARLPRCTKCQSLAKPSCDEYSHMGDTTILFFNLMLLMVIGSNKNVIENRLIEKNLTNTKLVVHVIVTLRTVRYI